jgi:hypothetical protein
LQKIFTEGERKLLRRESERGAKKRSFPSSSLAASSTLLLFQHECEPRDVVEGDKCQ